MKVFCILCLGVIILLLPAVIAIGAETSIDIGSRLELFVDYFLIDSLDGANLKLHHPIPAGVAIKFDNPWEGEFLPSSSSEAINDRCFFNSFAVIVPAPFS